ncbi:78 kDa glucose-regulated protein [Nosema bombycis CQ1]|uniref:78 kDa glucose-regulated protein n=1 Tax=Nosema bombycis (strain CQ1 / CVCC 102059) TaxID=578461 RepID=R0KLN1_NOSB1|nr:78 kDa glucose-regulated protein [Nosema bombycis CQ1]|eukprot:EOB11536.1 78 kDa glucose-regulated protein [Nosema bombycis CQ1]
MFTLLGAMCNLVHALSIEKEKVAVGLDLGTTFSCVGIYRPTTNEVSFLEFRDKTYIFPSVAYYNAIWNEEKKQSSGVYQTGWDIYDNETIDKESGLLFYGFKRAMGLSSTSDISKANNFTESVTYKVSQAMKDGKNLQIYFPVLDAKNNVIDKTSPEQLSSLILKALKAKIEEFYEIQSLVITVPAYFTDSQISATKEAAAMAGLVKPSIDREPVAAAYSYQVKKGLKETEDGECVMVFDLGGGTFDISVVSTVSGGLFVEKNSGDNYLGGENVNDNLTNYFGGLIKKEKNIDVFSEGNKNLKLRLRQFVEKFKIELCDKVNQGANDNEAHVKDFFLDSTNSMKLSLNKTQFDNLNSAFHEKIRNVLFGADYGVFRKEKGTKSNDEPLDVEEIKKVILVGGSTRIKKVREDLAKWFPRAEIYDKLDADKVVAEGAAFLAAKNANLLTASQDVHLVDVAPLNVGICTDRNNFEAILKKDTPIPGSASKEFTTSHDGQTNLRIQLAQGFRALFSENQKLGEAILEIPPGQPRGVPRIVVTITMGADNSIDMFAEDAVTKKSTKLNFNADQTRVDDAKYQQLLKEAKENEKADQELREKYNAYKALDETLHYTKKRLEQPGISEDDKITVEAIINGTQKWMDSNEKTATKMDYEEKLASFKESVEGILDKKVEKEAEVPKPEEEKKETGREEL